MLIKDLRKPSLFIRFGGEALWFPVLALSALGLLFVYSASSIYSAQKYSDEFVFAKRHLFYLMFSMMALVLGIMIPLDFFKKIKNVFMHISILGVFLTLLPPFGKKVSGAARWLEIPYGFRFQPSEILKIALIIFIAGTLSQKNLKKIWIWWPLPLAFLALCLQPDFGSCLMILFTLLAMLFIYGVPLRDFFLGALLLVPVSVGVMVMAPYRLRRILNFWDPFQDPLGAGFQVIQSFLGIASGGWFGKGLGGSQQKLFFLPEAHTDFVLSVIAEEMGFAGVCCVVLLYTVLFFTLSKIMVCAKDDFQRLCTTGVLALFFSTAVTNMAVAVGLFPPKGLPLPFLSAGGSALVTNFFMLGVCAQVFRRAAYE